MTLPDIRLFADTFVFARDAHAVIPPPPGQDGPAVRKPLTDDLLLAHLEGTKRVGTYIIDKDGTSNQLIVDIDIPKDPPERREDPAEWARVKAEAKRVLYALDDMGVEAFITSSKSRGYHVRSLWPPTPAGDLRRVGQYVVGRAGLPPETEVFPKQDERPGPDKYGRPGLGNFVWLPLHGGSLKEGKTALLDDENGLMPFPDQWEALKGLRRNTVEALANALAVAEEASPSPPPVKIAPPVGDIIPATQRNITLASIAGTMQRRGMTEAAIEAALQVENKAKCHPPLSESEVLGIVRSIGRYRPASKQETSKDPQDIKRPTAGTYVISDKADDRGETPKEAGEAAPIWDWKKHDPFPLNPPWVSARRMEETIINLKIGAMEKKLREGLKK